MAKATGSAKKKEGAAEEQEYVVLAPFLFYHTRGDLVVAAELNDVEPEVLIKDGSIRKAHKDEAGKGWVEVSDPLPPSTGVGTGVEGGSEGEGTTAPDDEPLITPQAPPEVSGAPASAEGGKA